MPPRFLDQFFDVALEIDPELTIDQIAGVERERLADQVAMASVAKQIPRRLSEGTRDELALDKVRSRRIEHALRQSFISWSGGVIPLGDPTVEQRQRGAQVDWPLWWAEHEPWLQARIRYIATWAKKSSHLLVGKEAIVRLSNELSWLEYAMRS